MENYLHNSNIFRTFEGWIGGSCKPSDKGRLTALPHFKICQQNLKIVSNMLRFEDLPEMNSPRWLSLEDFPDEIWKDVVGYEGLYMVSNYGRILSLGQEMISGRNHSRTYYTQKKILKARRQTNDYMRVALHKDKEFKYYLVHRIVALAFLGDDNGLQVDHINFNRSDNRLENLRYLSLADNMRYAYLKNNKGSEHYRQMGSKTVIGYVEDKEVVRYNSIKEFAKECHLVYQSVKIWFQNGDIEVNGITYRKNKYKNLSMAMINMDL